MVEIPFRRHATAVWLRLRLNEIGPLASLLAVSLFGFGFFKLADEIREGGSFGFDDRLLLALRVPGDLAQPIGPSWLPETMRDITAFGSVFGIVYVTACVVLYLAITARRRAALFVVIAIGGGELLSTGLKLFFHRPRPDLVPHGMETFTASFPSGHAMLSAIAYLTLAILLARVERSGRVKAFVMGLGVVTTLLVGISRIYLGVHWPSDVLAGWCIGAAWASLCWFVALQLQRQAVVEAPDPPPPA
ncbi:phosphoesterase [Methylobacterium indicum]|uniref:Phosphatase PAP2 family protein n=1 Tax=Methylobacterium indicum TaxID=1775910 RepID=A0A0J6TJK8_9HYPH|nr:phosphatase PAP2 family protein [Methylobacterium indicum]KMO12516.1 phosphoesterase [Methylobacterium indicum]KMO14162.1 phosphoesterase [Methylobacterium indicum]KTS13896.1 phosphoesterase [Methylobacterium indicum]KTS37253.1 phosphoesterase [Methylobacterium indicum]KTS42761.1 phosphoesterase [Methylobacterium indicum]